MLVSTLLVVLAPVHGPSHDPLHGPSHDPLHGGAHEHAHEGHSHAQDAAWRRPAPPTDPVHVGSGAHRYRWDSEWLQLPEGRAWLDGTHGCMVLDSKDRLFLSAEVGPAVLVFEPTGEFAYSFGEDWGAGLHGLAIETETVTVAGPEGEPREETREVLYGAHIVRQGVVKTTLDGEVLLRIGPPPESAGIYPDLGYYKPTSVAVAPDGTIFIADGYGLSWIHRYTAQGEYLDSFGGRGQEPHQLLTPHGLWMDRSTDPATLLVADREKHRIARFSLAGEFLGGTDSESGLLRRPCHLQFAGDLGIVADLAGRMTLVDRKLELVAHLGDNQVEAERANVNVTPNQWRHGEFTAPHCAHANSKGEIFVMDWNVAGRITRLVPDPEE